MDITWTTKKRKLGKLADWSKNPRKLSDHDREHIQQSIDKFGLADPLVVNLDGQLIGGHQRKKIMLAMEVYGSGAMIDVRVPSRQLTEAEAAELNVRLNKNSGEWDFEILGSEFEFDDLTDWGFTDLELELGGLEKEEEEPPEDPGAQVDKAEELQEKWGTELGQLWQLGEHRVVCGDCTDGAVVDAAMGGEEADMVSTDPPYNVSYQDNESVDSLKARNRRTDGLVVSNDSMTDEQFDDFLTAFLLTLPLKAGGSYYLCAPPGHPETQFRNALNRVSGLQLRECIVWVKDRFVFGRQDYHWRHESILYGWKKGASHYFIDDRTQDTVWEHKRPGVSKDHPTMKPIELPEKAIKNSTTIGQVVFDGFLGSGTTMAAAHRLKRRCFGIELEPKYVAVTLERWHQMTGLDPQLINSHFSTEG